MRQKSLLLLLPFLLLSCGGKKNSGQLSDTAVQIVKPEFPQIVPFETGIETEQEILLSEIADSIRYIPLETNNKCLIRGLKEAISSGQKNISSFHGSINYFSTQKMVNSYGHWGAKAADRVSLTGSCRSMWMKKRIGLHVNNYGENQYLFYGNR